MTPIVFIVGCVMIVGSIYSTSKSVDQLRKSLERDGAKTQALLTEIRDKLGK